MLMTVVEGDPKASFSIATIYVYIPDTGILVRVFANGPGDEGTEPDRVIPKTKTMILCLTLSIIW